MLGRLTEPAAPLAPLRNPVFRTIWLAMLVSGTGSMMQLSAAQWLMTELTDSHRLVALVQASNYLPIAALGLFAGVIADSFDRRAVMLAAQTFMFLGASFLAAVAWLGTIDPWLLILLTLAAGAGAAINSPAWQASVRLQVGEINVPPAVALNAIAYNFARSLGPALGGLVIALSSAAMAFTLNAATYLVLIFVLARWRPPRLVPRRRAPLLRSLWSGLSFCAHSGPLRRVMIRGIVFGVGAGAGQSLLPLVARDLLGGDEIDFGLLLGTFGAGSIAGALLVSSVRSRWGNEFVVNAASLAFSVALFLFAAVRGLEWALGASFVAGAAWVGALTSLNVATQLRSPDGLLGRCLSIYQAVTFGGVALGAYAWGWVADQNGLSWALYAASASLLASLLLRFIAPMPE